MKVLNVTVFKPAGFPDCTANGLSSRVNGGFLFYDCSNDEALEYCKNHDIDPAKQFIMVSRTLWGEDHSYAEPLVKSNEKAQMFGGNFLYTSDSRMYRTGNVYKVPVPIHDRFETWEDFDGLSR